MPPSRTFLYILTIDTESPVHYPKRYLAIKGEKKKGYAGFLLIFAEHEIEGGTHEEREAARKRAKRYQKIEKGGMRDKWTWGERRRGVIKGVNINTGEFSLRKRS